ncbi:hypothetical protein DCM91_13860 [Chitinophaga costaii]|nr:hypothetical protein DCM91_13860 [Chitinophaga costaii]
MTFFLKNLKKIKIGKTIKPAATPLLYKTAALATGTKSYQKIRHILTIVDEYGEHKKKQLIESNYRQIL